MVKHADITFEDNLIIISGEIAFANVMSVYEKSLPYLLNHPNVLIDFSQVTKSDSSGLALIIEWLKRAEQAEQTVRFKSIPQGLLAIAKAACLEEIVLQHSEL